MEALNAKSCGIDAWYSSRYFRWTELVRKSFLSDPMKTQYIDLLNNRFKNLDLTNSEFLT
jgi:hypothetical protein